MILKGYVTEIRQGGRYAKVKTLEGEIIDSVIMLHAYGEASFMQSDRSSMVLLLCPLGSKTSVFGIPYNVLLQPELEATEKAVGNFKTGNKITFKADRTNEIEGDTGVIGSLYIDDEVNTASEYRVNGTKVIGARGAAITAPTGGATVDTEARTAINAIIARMVAHGLIS